MKLFILDDIETDARYCRVDVTVACNDALTDGERALPELERQEIDVLELQMDEDEGGLELPDYVGNADNALVLRRACAEAIVAGFVVGEHELLPAQLINEKGRVHSDDYVILNPLGQAECLHLEASEMDGDEEEPMVKIMGRWYLSSELVPRDRDLFRVKGVIGYVLSERLVAFIEAEGFTNFHFLPVAVR